MFPRNLKDISGFVVVVVVMVVVEVVVLIDALHVLDIRMKRVRENIIT